MWSHGDREVLSGVRLSEVCGYGWMDLFLRNGEYREILFRVRRKKAGGRAFI